MTDESPLVEAASSQRSERARRLRIAMAVFFGALTVVLCVLWVRSYWRYDALAIGLTDKRGFLADSASGVLSVLYIRDIGKHVNLSRWFLGSFPIEHARRVTGDAAKTAFMGFLMEFHSNVVSLAVPCWLCVVLSGAISIIFWCGRSWQFSLRTMLIAMTLFAVMLGVAVLAGR